MAGLAHIFLHVGLCEAVARASPETTIAMHVKMSYRIGGTELDRTFKFPRGDGTQAVLEFDIPRSAYRLQLDVPKYDCATSDFLMILADQSRNVTETLTAGPAAPPNPMVLMAGTAPISFLYVKPTLVLFPKGLVCDQPVTTALPPHVNVEYDQGGYYAQLFLANPPIDEPVLALRLRTPTGPAHYVRIPIPLPASWGGWPNEIQFNVSEDEIDGLATEKTETLLCPKLWETSVH